ncbi:hypothetical protein HQ529_00825 [Candidatus Woesearchaeota archaeon]|nr:hypothetical protein [Candidatus Woesearchaeota archaeon]
MSLARQQIEKIHRTARIAHEHSNSFSAESIGYQLLRIFNNKISIMDYAWTDEGQKIDLDVNPNVERDELVASVNRVLETRVNDAYMLSKEDKQAAAIFKEFTAYAMTVDWNNQSAYEKLSQIYHELRDSVRTILTQESQRKNNMALKRFELTGKFPTNNYD